MKQDEISVKIPFKKKIGKLIGAWIFTLISVMGLLTAVRNDDAGFVVLYLIFIFMLGILPMYIFSQPAAVASKKGVKLPSKQGIVILFSHVFIPWSSVKNIELATGFFEKKPMNMPNRFRTKSFNPSREKPVKYIFISTDRSQGFVTLTKRRKESRIPLSATPSICIFNEYLTDENHEELLKIMKKYQDEHLAESSKCN